MLNLELLLFKSSVSYNPVDAKKYFKCVCIYVCISIPWEDSIMKNRIEAARDSVNIEPLCVFEFYCVCTGKMAANLISRCIVSVCVCVCVRVAVIHWPDSSSWGSAHIPVITAVPTADWLLSALLRRCLSVRQSHCWFQTKVNTLEQRWQNRLVIDELQSTFDKQFSQSWSANALI